MPSARRAGALLAALTALAAPAVLAAPVAASPDPSLPYVVVLTDDVRDPRGVAAEHARAHGARVSTTYTSALKGYAATLTSRAHAEVLRDRRVAYVEPDGVASAAGVQSEPTWGLDRIDQAVLPLDRSYGYGATGLGVTAYVIDSGIHASHVEFDGRVSAAGFDVIDGLPTDDCHGHGTHVAGTLGGATYGVAKAVALVPVRVLDCRGRGADSGVIKAVDWVTAQHQPGVPAVANMSIIAGKASTAMDQAVKSSIADGVSYVVAAGNGSRVGLAQDACKSSPGRVPEAMTVSATTATDEKLSYANYGSCVDWFAPGASITSALHTSDTATGVKSGTSMAAPHTAGVAALHLEQTPAATPAQVRDALFAGTTKGIVSSSRTANNHLLWNGYVSATG